MISIITIIVLVLAETVRMDICGGVKHAEIIDFKTHATVDFQKDCGPGAKPCVLKCCAENEVLFKKPNVNSVLCRNLKILSKEFPATAIHTLANNTIIKSGNGSLSFFEDFRILYSERFVNKACSSGPTPPIILKNGTASFYPDPKNSELKYTYVAPDFCMEKMLGFSNRHSGQLVDAFVLFYRTDNPESIIRITKFSAYGGVVSAFFLLLVFVIHCLIKVLRGTPKGKLLMGFVVCLMLFYVYNAWYAFSRLPEFENPSSTYHKTQACKWVSPIGYFMFVSSFFWLNAMCYDIYRKFRSSKLKSLETDDRKKMWLYSAYAIGVPLLCTVISLLLDQYGSDQVRPGFHNCRQDDDNRVWKRLYVRLPTGLVVLSNVVMWILTVRNVRHVRMQFARTARNESTHTRKGEQLSNVYGRLFILMGVNWMIEIILIPVQKVEDWLFYLTNVPNTLLGVWIFLVTVCSKDIFKKLCRRFGLTQNSNTTQVSQMTSSSRVKTCNRDKNADTART